MKKQKQQNSGGTPTTLVGWQDGTFTVAAPYQLPEVTVEAPDLRLAYQHQHPTGGYKTMSDAMLLTALSPALGKLLQPVMQPMMQGATVAATNYPKASAAMGVANALMAGEALKDSKTLELAREGKIGNSMASGVDDAMNLATFIPMVGLLPSIKKAAQQLKSDAKLADEMVNVLYTYEHIPAEARAQMEEAAKLRAAQADEYLPRNLDLPQYSHKNGGERSGVFKTEPFGRQVAVEFIPSTVVGNPGYKLTPEILTSLEQRLANGEDLSMQEFMNLAGGFANDRSATVKAYRDMMKLKPGTIVSASAVPVGSTWGSVLEKAMREAENEEDLVEGIGNGLKQAIDQREEIAKYLREYHGDDLGADVANDPYALHELLTFGNWDYSRQSEPILTQFAKRPGNSLDFAVTRWTDSNHMPYNTLSEYNQLEDFIKDNVGSRRLKDYPELWKWFQHKMKEKNRIKWPYGEGYPVVRIGDTPKN